MSKDGGSAFPHEAGRTNTGMTLRDYFAAMAMQGFACGHAKFRVEFDPTDYSLFARHAYDLADAMLAERAK